MAKRKLTATQKLRRNVQRQVRRMEDAGYILDFETKEKIKTAPYQTLKSIQRNRYQRLYSGAYVTAEVVNTETGEITLEEVSGTVAKRVRKQAAAKQAAQTRAYRKKQREKSTSVNDGGPGTWEQIRRMQDAVDKENARLFSEGQIIFDNINEMIESYPTKGSKALSNILKSEIRKYGKESVLRQMAKAPEQSIAYARTICFYEDDDDALATAITEFIDVITGTIPTENESKEIGNLLDDMTDIEDEG